MNIKTRLRRIEQRQHWRGLIPVGQEAEAEAFFSACVVGLVDAATAGAVDLGQMRPGDFQRIVAERMNPALVGQRVQ